MTAQIKGFLTRADIGLRKPKSYSKSITPDQGGCALHYGGPAQKIKSHSQCAPRWKAWQDYHMDTHGWADIAYTLGVCDHGYVLAGRGVGIRTAANGTNAGNDDYYAVTWIGGEGETPTQAAQDAIEWAVLHLRKSGAGRKVKPHRYFKSTGCPGTPTVAIASRLDGKDISEPSAPAPSPTPTPTPTPVAGKEINMVIVHHPDTQEQFVCDVTTKRHINGEDRAVYLAAGVPYIDDRNATPDVRRVFLSRLFPIDSNTAPQ